MKCTDIKQRHANFQCFIITTVHSIINQPKPPTNRGPQTKPLIFHLSQVYT